MRLLPHMRLMLISAVLLGWAEMASAQMEMLNVSYDPTRELYQEFNQAFQDYWMAEKAQKVEVRQSHGGASSESITIEPGWRNAAASRSCRDGPASCCASCGM